MSTSSHEVWVALQRGEAEGLSGCAIYLPGDEIRCIHRGLGGTGYCGGILFTNGPENTVQVRVYESRRFTERRRTPRGNYRCQRAARSGVDHWLEVESHLLEVRTAVPDSAA